MILKIAVNSVSILLTMFLHIIMFVKLFKPININKAKRNITFIIGFIVLVTLSLFDINIFIWAGVCLGFSYLFAAIYSNSILENAIKAVSMTILIIGLELLTAWLITLLFSYPMQAIRENILFYSACEFFSKLLAYIAVWSACYFREYKGKKLTLKETLPIISLSISTASICVIVAQLATNPSHMPYATVTVVGMLLFIISSIGSMYLMERQIKMEIENARLSHMQYTFDDQLKHYNELYESQSRTHAIWHDMNKQLRGIYGLLEEGNNAQVIEYIEALSGKVASIINVVNTGYPSLDPIVKMYSAIAETEHINFIYSIKLNNVDRINKMDMAIIVGNALDNAFEAVKGMYAPQIALSMYTTTQDLFITIENTTNSEIRNTRKISSTKVSSNRTGFGLNAIREISAQYNGDVQIICREKRFIMIISLEI